MQSCCFICIGFDTLLTFGLIYFNLSWGKKVNRGLALFSLLFSAFSSIGWLAFLKKRLSLENF